MPNSKNPSVSPSPLRKEQEGNNSWGEAGAGGRRQEGNTSWHLEDAVDSGQEVASLGEAIPRYTKSTL